MKTNKAALIRIVMITMCWLSMATYAAEEYKLGVGDVVRVNVYNNPDLATEAQLAEDGSISFPLVGKAVLGGLSKNDAEARLAKMLTDGGFLKQAQVNLLILQYRSQQVSVLGEVHKPGKYPIGATSTVTDLIAQAGGISEKGSQVITVIRRDKDGNQTKEKIDLGNLLDAGNVGENLQVSAEDIIFVPQTPVFYVYGEVQKPGAYPLDRNMTIRQALSVGGGLTVRGTERGLRVTRRGSDGVMRTERVDPSDLVKEGDVVQVKESLF